MAGTLLATGALFAETIILARHLSTAALGTLFLILAYPEAVQQLLDFRVRDAMTRYLGRYLATGELARAAAVMKLLWWADAASAFLSLLLVATTAGLVSGLFLEGAGHAELMAIYAGGLFFGSLDSASNTVLRVLDRFALSFTMSIYAAGCRLGSVIVAVAIGGDVETIVIARAVGEALAMLGQAAVTLLVLRPILGAHARTPIAAVQDEYGELRSFLLATNVTGMLRMASTKLDTILVGALASPSTVAIYRIALQFARIPLQIGDPLATVVYPRFARAAATGQWGDVRRIARAVTAVVAAATVPGTLIAFVFGGDLLALITGERFREAATPLSIALVGTAIYGVCFWMPSLFLTRGHAGGLLRITAVGTALQMAALAVLVPVAGAEGAAISVALYWAAAVGLQARYVRRHRLLDAPGATFAAADT